MNLHKICVSVVSIFAVFATVSSARDDDGFLNVTCNEASDCYLLESKGLSLTCYYDEQKCKCDNSFSSDFNLKWEDGQSLMSKYGPCGARGDLAVGCQDGFVCLDNQCRDPSNTRSVKVTPFVFEESKCPECEFDEMRLRCNRDSDQCECAEVYLADARSSYWDIRSYDGNNNCSVGKFGPCGTRNGITIDCHGDGITCLNANHLISDVGEDCASQKNCKEGLLCSLGPVCIELFSLEENKTCTSDNECQKGLQCKRDPRVGPWSYARCTKTTTESEN